MDDRPVLPNCSGLFEPRLSKRPRKAGGPGGAGILNPALELGDLPLDIGDTLSRRLVGAVVATASSGFLEECQSSTMLVEE